MSRRHLKLLSVIFFTLVSVLTSCHSSKKVADNTDTLIPSTLQEAMNQVITSTREWEELQVPVKLTITQPEKFNVSGRAYMIRNQRIFISMRLLGLEVASLDITPDSIIMLDKYHRRQINAPIAKILKDADITLADIQDALLGRVFINGLKTLSEAQPSDFILTALSANKWKATPKKRILDTSYSFIISENDSPERLTAKINGSPVAIEYADDASTPYGEFAQNIKLSTIIGNTNLDITLRWNFNSVKWRVGNGIPQSRPEGYETLDAVKFFKSLSQSK